MLLDLLPTQNRLRHPGRVALMADFVRGGGIFDREALAAHGGGTAPIVVAHVAGLSRPLLHDGHHRVAAILLAGRPSLHPTEFVEERWGRGEYGEVNVAADYLTPFDPATECRLPDFRPYKDCVRRLLSSGVLPPGEVAHYAAIHASRFKEPRTIHSAQELL